MFIADIMLWYRYTSMNIDVCSECPINAYSLYATPRFCLTKLPYCKTSGTVTTRYSSAPWCSATRAPTVPRPLILARRENATRSACEVWGKRCWAWNHTRNQSFGGSHHPYIYIYTYIYIYIYLHLYTFIYIYLHLSRCIYIYLHLFTFIYIYLHLFTFIYIYLHLCTYLLYLSIHLYFYKRACIQSYIYIYTYGYTQVHESQLGMVYPIGTPSLLNFANWFCWQNLRVDGGSSEPWFGNGQWRKIIQLDMLKTRWFWIIGWFFWISNNQEISELLDYWMIRWFRNSEIIGLLDFGLFRNSWPSRNLQNLTSDSGKHIDFDYALHSAVDRKGFMVNGHTTCKCYWSMFGHHGGGSATTVCRSVLSVFLPICLVVVLAVNSSAYESKCWIQKICIYITVNLFGASKQEFKWWLNFTMFSLNCSPCFVDLLYLQIDKFEMLGMFEISGWISWKMSISRPWGMFFLQFFVLLLRGRLNMI